jgi:hypothetical protein
MTDKELREIVADLARQVKETDKQVKQTNKQLGELGNRWGSYTEGMAYPSLEKVLRQRFKMTVIAPRVHSKRNNYNLELDVFGYANDGRDEAVIVEVKSQLTEENFQQMLNTLATFPKAFAEHANKKLYGIFAAVNVPENMKQRVLKHGIYLARISDETFKITVPHGFKPKNYGKKSDTPTKRTTHKTK